MSAARAFIMRLFILAVVLAVAEPSALARVRGSSRDYQNPWASSAGGDLDMAGSDILDSAGNLHLRDSVDVSGNLSLVSPTGTAASYNLTITASQADVAQSAQLQMVNDAATPYLKLVVTDQLGVPSTPGKLYKDLLAITGTVQAGLFRSAAAETADNTTGIALGYGEQLCYELSTPGSDVCVTNNGTGLQLPTTNLLNNSVIYLGSTVSGAGALYFNTLQTPDSIVMAPGSLNNTLLFVQRSDIATDFAAPLVTNPTIRIQSADETQVNDYIRFAHDQDNGMVTTGNGAIALQPNRVAVTKGGSINVTQAQTQLTCAGGGSATLTWAEAFPIGSQKIGVTSRIAAALTGSTGFSIGDTGAADPDMYGAQAVATQGATTTPASQTVSVLGTQITAAGDIVLTFTGPACTAGVVTLVASYTELIPPNTN